jgi:hypothetical protein
MKFVEQKTLALKQSRLTKISKEFLAFWAFVNPVGVV